MAKMRTATHNSRTNSKGRVHGSKHNDRNFYTEKADNIDSEKSVENVYHHTYQELHPDLTFDEAELKFYEEHFQEQLAQTNQKYIDQRHPERCKTMDEWRRIRQWSPEESFMQIGNMAEHADKDILQVCYKEYRKFIDEWNEDNGRPFTVLNSALHVDEAVPHIQQRRVWHYTDEQGVLRVGQEKALEKAGVSLPRPGEKETRYNHRKKTFDHMCRQKWIEILEKHGLEIEKVPQVDVSHNQDKEDMINKKYQQLTEEIKDMEQLLVDVKAVDDIKTTKLPAGKVIVDRKELEQLREQAKAYAVLKPQVNETIKKEARLNYREENLKKIQNERIESQIHIDARSRVVAQKEEKVDKKLSDANSMMKEAEQKMAEAQRMYQNQLHLNQLLQQTIKEKKELQRSLDVTAGVNSMMERELDDIRKRVDELCVLSDERVAEAIQDTKTSLEKEINEYKNKINVLESKTKNMANAQSALMKTMRYVRDNFAGTISRHLLNAAIGKGNDWLAEDGFEELSKNRDSLVPKAIRAEITLDLTYKNGNEGQGLYNGDIMLFQADTITAAKALCPNANIKNELSSPSRSRSR